MTEKEWLEKSILIVLQLHEVDWKKRPEILKNISELVESYEAMKQI